MTRDENLTRLASEAFSLHMLLPLVYEPDGQLVGYRLWSERGFHDCEIAITGGRLVIAGDVTPTMFPRQESTLYHNVQRVAEAHPGYLARKVQQSMGCTWCGWEFDDDVAAGELQSMLDDEDRPHARITIESAISILREVGSRELAVSRLLERGDGFEADEVCDLGLVPAARVYYARAACRRVIELTGGGS
ncbi:MAG: hypothetical protein ACODAB_07285 [Gemmatimonadota bacterium]